MQRCRWSAVMGVVQERRPAEELPGDSRAQRVVLGLASATVGSITPVDIARPVWSVDLVAPRYGELLRITGGCCGSPGPCRDPEGRRRVPAMTSQRILVGVATAQLAAQLVGMSVAVRRGLPYDVRVVGMRGEADDIGRDLWDKGTALSAPVTMLGTQAVAIALVATNPNASVGRVAAKVLGGLGALNIGGYLGERVVRERLRPSGWDHVETPVAVVSLALATAMAALGLGRVAGR